jgi:hypothetical protein
MLLYYYYFYLKKKIKFEGCHQQSSQRELADKTKSWPDQKKKKKYVENLPTCRSFPLFNTLRLAQLYLS